jgi:hypothetical protein
MRKYSEKSKEDDAELMSVSIELSDRKRCTQKGREFKSAWRW